MKAQKQPGRWQLQRQNWRPYRAGPAVLLLVALLVTAPAQAKLMYRWVNEQGATETSHALPPGYAHKGYEILDSETMRIIRTVPPEMSEEQYKEKLERERALAECEQALDRVKFLYEQLADIDKAEAAALRSLEVRVQNAQQNLTNARQRLSGLEAEAARQERQGSTITKNLLAELEKANSQIASVEREIRQRAADKDKMKLEYEEERRIFTVGKCTMQTPETVVER